MTATTKQPAFAKGDRVVDRRDTKAVEGTVIEQRADGLWLVAWPEGRFWQRPSDLVKAIQYGETTRR